MACCLYVISAAAKPEFLDDEFELPAGFHIQRVAGQELSGGSYALRFETACSSLYESTKTSIRSLEPH